jgi:hypothetical protein
MEIYQGHNLKKSICNLLSSFLIAAKKFERVNRGIKIPAGSLAGKIGSI